MKAWILEESPGAYRFGEIDAPEPGPGDVRVRVVASALNHMDLWITKGQPKPHLPHVPGCDVAGIVESAGAEVEGVAVGDEVVINPAVSSVDDVVRYGNDSPLGRSFAILGEQRWGGHGELVVAPARNVAPRPAERSWAECAAYPLVYLTAWRMLRRARVKAGETVLVVGVGGGVGSAALVLAERLGARVLVTSTDPAKLTQAAALGAHDGFDSQSDWKVRADVVIESVGPATWDRSVRALAPGGRLVVCGGTSGQEVTLSLPRLFFKQHELIGSTMGSYEEFAQVTDLVNQGLPIVVDQTLPLDRYPEALNRLSDGRQLGKIVLEHENA